MKKVAILQSNYIPWKGYFDIIRSVDEFIIGDDVQYTWGDWRNRNKIKTANGPEWLTIPVGKHYSAINNTLISDNKWAKNHWAKIQQAYSKATYFKQYKEPFEQFYRNNTEQHISLVNFELISIINNLLGIGTKITWSTDYLLSEGKNERITDLVKQAGGGEYVSGPAAKAYMDEPVFTAAGINVSWMDYSGYPEYTQLYPPFEHGVTVLDLIFNEGPNALSKMKTLR